MMAPTVWFTLVDGGEIRAHRHLVVTLLDGVEDGAGDHRGAQVAALVEARGPGEAAGIDAQPHQIIGQPMRSERTDQHRQSTGDRGYHERWTRKLHGRDYFTANMRSSRW